MHSPIKLHFLAGDVAAATLDAAFAAVAAAVAFAAAVAASPDAVVWSFGVCCQRHKMLDIKGKSSGNCDCGEKYFRYSPQFSIFFAFAR